MTSSLYHAMLCKCPLLKSVVAVLLLVVAASGRGAWAVGEASGTALQARRLELKGAALRAEGEVQLRFGSCRLRANQIDIDGKGALGAMQPCLEALPDPGGLALVAHRLRRDRDGGLGLTHARAGLCRCGGPVSLSAPSAWVGARGERLHLTWPRLKVGPAPVAILPYLAVPLRPGVSGLLTPELGYSGRDGLRISQGAYAAFGRHADAAAWVGWVQNRGVSGRLRTRYYADSRGSGELDLAGVRDGSTWRGWVRGGLGLRGGGWALRVDPYLVSDAQVPGDLASDPREVFARYQRSRLWGEAQVGPVRLVGWGDLYQELGSPLPSQPGDLGRVGLRVDLRPVSVLGPLSVDANAVVAQALWGGAESSGHGSGHGAGLPSSAEWAPRVSVDTRLGPLSASASGSYLAQVRWGAAPGMSTQALELDQAAVLTAEVGLPLGRSFGEQGLVKHLLEPVVAWQSAWGAGSAAQWTQARFERLPLPRGHFAGVGLRSSVVSRRGTGAGRQLAGLDLRLWAAQGESRATGWMRVAPVEGVTGRLALALRVDDPGLEQLDARGCLDRWGGRLCAGYLRHRGADGSSTVIYSPGGIGSAGSLLDPLVTAANLDELRVMAGLSLRRVLLGGQVAVDPVRGQVTQGGAWIRSPEVCGCLGLSLAVQFRAGQAVPDVLAQLTLRRPGWARCLAR